MSNSETKVINCIKKGLYKRKRSPAPLVYISFTTALNKYSIILLAKEMAYYLSTKSDYRIAREDRYFIAYNILPVKNWDQVLVMQLKKNIKQYKDIICVNTSEYNIEMLKEYPTFKHLLLLELNLIRKGEL